MLTVTTVLAQLTVQISNLIIGTPLMWNLYGANACVTNALHSMGSIML